MKLNGKIILFDIDDTVALTSYRWMEVTEMFMRMGGFNKVKSASRYEFEKSFDIPDKELPGYYQFMEENFPYDSLEIIPGMDRLIHKLIDEFGAVVKFITNRSKQQVGVTSKWLVEKLGIEHPQIIFTSDDKVEKLFSASNYSYLVDNNLQRCKLAKKHFITPILFSCVGVDDTKEKDYREIMQATNALEVLDSIENSQHNINDISNSPYFVILNIGAGVKKVIQVYKKNSKCNQDWVVVTTEDKQELFVHKNKLFETKTEAYHYIEVE